MNQVCPEYNLLRRRSLVLLLDYKTYSCNTVYKLCLRRFVAFITKQMVVYHPTPRKESASFLKSSSQNYISPSCIFTGLFHFHWTWLYGRSAVALSIKWKMSKTVQVDPSLLCSISNPDCPQIASLFNFFSLAKSLKMMNCSANSGSSLGP